MAYLINNYDGTPLVTVQDRTLNLTATSIKIPGRDYRPYGEVIVENLVYMLQNFSSGSAPLNPTQGQIWYDSNIKKIKVFDGSQSVWLTVGTPQSGSIEPLTGSQGEIFYHTNKKQLFVWDTNTAKWVLIAPVGAQDNLNPTITSVATNTAFTAGNMLDVNGVTHAVIQVTIEGQLAAIWSVTDFNASVPGFISPIRAGLNLRSNNKFVGVATQADLATNSTQLDGAPANRYMRQDRNNEPDQNGVRALGSAGKRYGTVFAVNFDGAVTNATNAVNAQNASTATNAVNAQNATNLAGQPASFYRNATNINAGTLDVGRLPYVPVNRAGDTLQGPLVLQADPATALGAATKQYVDNRVLRVFETSLFAIANATPYTFTHGLGVIPKFVTVDAACVTAQGGYVPGDVIQLAPFADIAGVSEGLGILKSSTNVTVYVGANGPGEAVGPAGVAFIMLASSWNLQVRAFA